MLSRRHFLRHSGQLGLAAATAPLWANMICKDAFAQSLFSNYKAVVLVTLFGGNDGNNMLIPLDTNAYQAYASMRSAIALPQASCLPLNGSSSGIRYGLHPSLPNLAGLYNSKRASIIANVGPIGSPATKPQLMQNPALVPQGLMNHVVGRAQWESASTDLLPATGWGGRVADYLTSQSGTLPPLLDAGPASIFTVGHSVQAIAVQANSGAVVALPAGIDSAILSIGKGDVGSSNHLVSQVAQLRMAAIQQQDIINQAQSANTPLQTAFPATPFGQVLNAIAKVINGRNVTGASRQIFYCQQGNYDTHTSQLSGQSADFAELDSGLGAFMKALDEMGLGNQVLVCTHSDFNRTMQANTNGGY